MYTRASLMVFLVGAVGVRTAGATRSLAADRELEHFELLNELRAEGFTCPGGSAYAPNSEPLVFDCRLWRASWLHSQDMADQNYFSHTSLDGRSPWARASAQGISANGENIAAGRSSASGVLEQWKNSDGHCKNMMNPNNRMFAVGYGYSSSSSYKHYWTQMLRRSLVDADESCLGNSTTSEPPTTTSLALETTGAPPPSSTASGESGQPTTSGGTQSQGSTNVNTGSPSTTSAAGGAPTTSGDATATGSSQSEIESRDSTTDSPIESTTTITTTANGGNRTTMDDEVESDSCARASMLLAPLLLIAALRQL